MTQLLQLNLIDNQVVEVESLVTLSALSDLWLNGNPLSNTAITVHIPQIEANGTFVRR